MTAALKRLRGVADREYQRRARTLNAQSFALEAFAAGHAPQLAFMQDRAQWIHVMCARQSGKSWGDDGIMLDNALRVPGSTNLLLGLTGVAARTNNWEPIWRPLCARHGIPESWHNEQRMITRFPNGARVMFAGTDDLTHVKGFLGNSLPGGVVILDESQDQRDGVIRYILRQLLVPMLTETTRVILSGVLPDVPAGMFLELGRYDEETKTGGKGPGWAHHEWGRAANVHSLGVLEKYKADHGVSDDDPQIQRDWYMRRIWDAGATAYRYRREVAGYDGNPPPWLEFFSVGIDPGSRDRTAIQVWGWGTRDRNVYQVHEWVTARNANTHLSDIARECEAIRKRWNAHRWVMDMSLGKMTIDTFGLNYGVPMVKAANKSDLPGQVARMADLLAQGRAKVIIGSALEEDLQRATWDRDARAKGLYRWSSAWHPDAADAARYGLQGYFDMYQEVPPPPTADEASRLRNVERLRPPSDEEWQRTDVQHLGYGRQMGGDYGPPD